MFMGLFRSEATQAKCGFLTIGKPARKMDRNKYRKYLKRPEMDQFIVIICSISILIFDMFRTLLRDEYAKLFGVKM